MASFSSPEDKIALDEIIQLAQIARPGVILAGFVANSTESGKRRPRVTLRHMRHEMLQQDGNLFLAFAVAAETCRGEKRSAGSKGPRANALLASASGMLMLVAARMRTSTLIIDRLPRREKLLVLQHVQQLGLQAGRHLADFIQQDCAFVAQLEFSRLGMVRAGEGSSFIAEQFALQQIGGNCGAIYFQKTCDALAARVCE